MDQLEELKYRIALTLLPNVGPVLARNLVSYCGSVEAVFKQKKKLLEKIPEIGPKTAAKIAKHEIFHLAEKEVEFIVKHNIKSLFYLDDNYPHRLKHCHDAPVLLYLKGEIEINSKRLIALVGSRSATEYGKKITEELVEGLKQYDVCIVSGLAYGIDIHAHRATLRQEMSTLGVLAHGLDRIYPGQHRGTAAKMILNGGLLTEYPSGTNPDRENFPSRNRIVAGICDAVIVVEAAKKGGALITADIAHSYSRDVFAVPGRIDDPLSEGCNTLIRINKAALITSAKDVGYLMGWNPEKEENGKEVKTISLQRKMFIDLTAEEEILVNMLQKHSKLEIDTLSSLSQMAFSKLSSVLLNLEMNGVLRSLPGKVYQLI